MVKQIQYSPSNSSLNTIQTELQHRTHKLRDLPVFYEGNDLKLMKDNFCKEANEKIPVQESIFRNFIVNEANFVSLSDKDEDMSWYGPFMDEVTYDGDFELEIELSSREKQIINQYCN